MKLFYVTMIIIFSSCLFAQDTWLMTYDPFQGIGDSRWYQPINLLAFNDEVIFNYNCHFYDYDPPFSWDWYNSGITKIDAYGNVIWMFDTGFEKTNCIAVTEDYHIIAAASSYNSNYLFKINSEGQLLWSINMNDFQVWSMDNTIDGNIIMSGEINTIPAIQKITNEGSEIWTQIYNINQNSTGRLYSVNSTESGDYIASGKITQNATNEDALVIKCDENGELLFFRTHDGFNSNDKAFSAVENSNGIILTVGCCLDVGFYYHLFWMLNSTGDTLWVDNSERGYNRSAHFNANGNNFLVAGWDLFQVEPFYYEPLTTEYNPSGYDKSIVILEDNLIFFTYLSDFVINICKSDLNGIVNLSDDNIITPTSTKLHNFPNPFNPTTTIEFSIQNNSRIELSIYNNKGQKIKTLTRNEFSKGSHSVIWSGDDESGKLVSSGVYLYKLNINDKTEAVKKCLLIK